MVDAVVSIFLERLFKTLAKESSVLLGYRSQFQKLQNDLLYMQSFFKDAERLKRKNNTLKCTLGNLQELIYEAEDILADCELLSYTSGAKKIPVKYQMGKQLRQINEKIASIKENITSILGPQMLIQSVYGNVQEESTHRWSSPIYDHTEVIGLEADTTKLKDWLLTANYSSGILAIGIVGMGGLGKTTLAQTVFNDKDIELGYEKRIWVSVSQTFTEERILKSILRNLGDFNIGDDCDHLLMKINQYLSGKRFMIVLDDVWGKDTSWWQRIEAGLPKGKMGSCVLVTTRKEEVAIRMGVQEEKIHHPRFLSEETSWLLFCNVAFAGNGGLRPPPEIESVGKEIVSKCGGLPLAIKAVGGMMLCKTLYHHEWRRIADHFMGELGDSDGSVMASLQLSYDELPSHLKSCFLSFSVYPEDCEISKDQLVRWWIGEGFVPVRNGRLVTEASEDCFTGLTNRCLIEVVEWDYNGKVSTCKVHDMVRDLVLRIATDESFSGSDIANCRRLGLNSDIYQQHITQTERLRAVISASNIDEVNKIGSDVGKRFCEFRYLRVLDLSKSIFDVSLSTLLQKVDCLKHLACFNLSNTHPLTQVPQSLEKLHQTLQILDLSYCHNLKILPQFVMTFKNLVVLDLSQCGSLECMPKGLENLLNLEVLLGFKPGRMGSQGSRLCDLRGLTRLRVLELRLTRADEIADDEDDDEVIDILIGLRTLQVLKLCCYNCLEVDNFALKLALEKICPPSQLLELSLKFYPGKVSPKWLNPESLPMLLNLSIRGGKLTRFNQSFWEKSKSCWRIESLKLTSLSLFSLEWNMILRAMQYLRTVHACWCPGLVSFPIEGVDYKGGVWKKKD